MKTKLETNEAGVCGPQQSRKSSERLYARLVPLVAMLLLPAFLLSVPGCGGTKAQKKREEFFTSGSREADQRATQRMAKEEQLAGSGEGAGEKVKTKVALGASTNNAAGSTNIVEGKKALFDRLGGEPCISNIVADFMPRALQAPRVTWERKAVKSGVFKRGENVAWQATPESIAMLQKHFVQFLSLATGGPADYHGKDMKSSHAGMKITNPEFDAAVGDLRSSLDRLQIPNKEQKELLSIIESTRP